MAPRTYSLRSRKEALRSEEEALESRTCSLGSRTHALESKEMVLDPRESTLVARDYTLGSRTKALDSRTKVLGLKASALGSRDEALGSRAWVWMPKTSMRWFLTRCWRCVASMTRGGRSATRSRPCITLDHQARRTILSSKRTLNDHLTFAVTSLSLAMDARSAANRDLA
jgi:hypothetical protein